MLLLVSKPGAQPEGVIHYHDIGDYLNRDEKLAYLRENRKNAVKWSTVTPNDAADWVNQRSDNFRSLFPLYGDGGIFRLNSLGIVTNRDAWCYNFSRETLSEQTDAMIAFFSAQSASRKVSDRDPTKFSWTRKTERMAARGDQLRYDEQRIYYSLYRPFCKEHAYFQRNANEEVYQQPRIYPSAQTENIGIAVSEHGDLPRLPDDGLPAESLHAGRHQPVPSALDV